MAHIEVKDFSRRFEDDFHRDVQFMADKLNDCIRDLANDHRGQFDELDRNFASYRDAVVQVFEKMTNIAYNDNRLNVDDFIKDVVLAAVVLVANEVDSRRFGSDRADDFIKDEMRNNPFLESVGRGNDRRDIARRDVGNSTRRSDTGPRERASSARERSNNLRNRDRHRDDYDDQPKRRGRLAKDKPMEDKRENTPRKQEVVSSVKIGDVITSSNYDQLLSPTIAPAYVAGLEQVILTEKGFSVIPYTGTSEVEWDKHNIDRFYPDLLGGGASTADLAAIALREAEKVKDQKISGFIKGENDEEVADGKLFTIIKSATYETPLSFIGTQFNATDIRNLLIEGHNGDFSWFGKYALNVNITQKVLVSGASNDVIERLKVMKDTKQMFMLVKSLIELASYIDPVAWKFIHDTITDRFNSRLVRNEIMMTLPSVTANWKEFTEIVASQFPQLAEVQNTTMSIMDSMGVQVEEIKEGDLITGREAHITVERNTVFLPVNSYDLGVATPSVNYDYASVIPGSMVFDAVKDLFVNQLPGSCVYLVTTDGMILEVCDASGMLNPQLYMMRKFN